MNIKKAFTLVEMMIVVAIIALLAIVAVPNILRARVDSNDASAKTTLKAISTALESYYALNSVYPTTSSNLIGPPPYLSKDYFVGNHAGFTFSPTTLGQYSYLITATPVSANHGSSTFTIQTGGILQ